MKIPNLFIVGHPRTGTSSLHYYLDQHPDVFMTAIKEPNYFADDFRQESDRFHGKPLYFPFRTEKRYLKLYEKWKNEKIGGEASATNLYSQRAARNIFQFNPGAKIIMMFREPVDFLCSYHSAAVFSLGEHEKDFSKALSLQKERRSGKHLSKRVITPSWLFYSDFIKYSEQVERYQACFDKHQIMVVIFDDFKNDLRNTFKRILRFLDMDSNFKPEIKIVNPNKNLKYPLLKRYTLDSPRFRNTLRFLVSDSIYAQMKKIYKDRLVEYKPREAIDQGLRHKLMEHFKTEVQRLSVFLDRDLVTLWHYDHIE